MRRTSVITALSITGVALASGAAIAANVGILSTTDGSEIGALSATAAAATAETAATTSVTMPTGTTQRFTVDTAGVVTVERSVDGLRLGDVATDAGWTWTLQQPAASALEVTFTDGARNVVFVAQSQPDGTISASVSEPTSSSTVHTLGDDERDDESDESDDESDERDDGSGHEAEEHHEGRDDDD